MAVFTKATHHATTIYRARWIAPVAMPPIENGCMVVDNGRILAIGKACEILPQQSGVVPIVDFGDAIVTPGFVNAHAHLELTCYRGMLEPGPLWPWLAGLIELRRLPESSDREMKSVEAAIAESLREGVTCVGDISRLPMPAWLLANSPIRAVSFIELISGARLEPNDGPSLTRHFAEMSTIDARPDITIGVSPHSTYTVTPDDFRHAVRLASEHNRPITTHYLETQEEVDWLCGTEGVVSDFLERVHSPNGGKGAGKKMADVLARSDLLNQSMLLAHVNYPSDLDIQHIAIGKVSVVWCPRAHRYYGHLNHRWKEMLEAGINVCVGTDSAACVSSLSILDELRVIKRLTPDAPGELLLRMGTQYGAKALGLGAHVGVLNPGLRADFVVFPMAAESAQMAIETLFDSDVRPGATVVEGRFVFPMEPRRTS